MTKYIISTIAFFIVGLQAIVAQVNVTATAPGEVAVGQQFQIKYSINANVSRINEPQFTGFEYLGSQQGYQSVNGQVSVSYTYYLQAQKKGTFTIQPATVRIGGKSYQSNTVTIKVTDSGGGNSSSSQSNNQGNNSTSSQGSTSDRDVFASISLSKTDVYLGEQIIVTLKIHTRLGLSGFEDVKFPDFNGFWLQDIEMPSEIQLRNETVNGVTYEVGVLKRSILYPQRTGQITIDGLEVDCIVRDIVERRNIWGRRYRTYQNISKSSVAPARTVIVNPLPPNAPASFNNAVGDFSFDVEISDTKGATNDALTLKTTITGNGNLKLIDPLDIPFPPDFDVYDPQTNNQFANTRGGAEGSKVFEYLMIPRSAGTFTIPALEFSFFNPATGKYETQTSEPIELEIEKGSGGGSGGNMVSGFSRDEVELIGSDIRFIKTGSAGLRPVGQTFFGSWAFILCYIVLFIVFFTVFLIKSKRRKNKANVSKLRHSQAKKISKRRLKTAEHYLKQNKKEEFYIEVLQALWGYLSDKLGIPASELNRDNISEKLESQSIEKETIQKFINVLDTCEFARYAPAEESNQMQTAYEQASQIISSLEQKLK